MMVCRTDLPTPTNEAVTAEQTEAQRNWEKVRMQPDSTSVTKTDMKPSSETKSIKIVIFFRERREFEIRILPKNEFDSAILTGSKMAIEVIAKKGKVLKPLM